MKINALNQSFNANKVAFGQIVRNDIQKKESNDNVQKLYIISGPSGVGKDTILDAFNKKYNNYLTKVVTSTTRNPRQGEINGVSYNFLTADEFKKAVDDNDFLEYVNVYADKYYGTRNADIEQAYQKGQNAVLVIDVEGAQKIKSKRKDAVAIFIKPASIDVLRKHLEKRGTETPESLKTRLDRAEYEIKVGTNPKYYDAVIQNNNDVEENVNDLFEILC